ncbi:MAG TPA: hypothetical protein VLC91_10000, partial [Spongiibacteraceae bacterium]|nr:hypothetical protein [Spongiibacteraceae bacterium]
LAVAANSPTFEFVSPVAYGAGYAVTVLQQPSGQICSLTQDTGIATSPIANVALTCTNIVTYTVTPSSDSNGSISPSTIVVVNTGGTQGFVATPAVGYQIDQWLVDGSPVQSGGSVYTLSNVTANHTVAVTFAQATLTSSVTGLALAVNCIPVSSCITMQNSQLTGSPRQITITNSSALDATNVVVTPSGLPSDTSISASTCSGVLQVADSCTITITPGALTSGDCTTGSAATPGTIAVSADNASTVNVDVVVLSYGCVYQQGFIYSIDDTTANTGSIGGKAAALNDTVPGQLSPSVGTPNWGAEGTDIGTSLYDSDPQGANDGATNTAAIIGALTASFSTPPYNASSPLPFTDYAAGLCINYGVDSDGNTPCMSGTCYSGWHLPAICELGSSGACASNSTNIQSQLFAATPTIAALGIVNGGSYWSSSEYTVDPSNAAIYWNFATGGSTAGPWPKSMVQGIRCARELTQ